jgi:two-component system response regulator RpfG
VNLFRETAMATAGTEPIAVVILDDDPALVSALSKMLHQGLQLAVEGFTEGGAAMEWLSLHSTRLLITDYLMPGPNGLDVVRWLRTQPGHRATPVLMLSGVEGASLTAAALAAGVSRLVTKPIRAEVLLREVAQLLSTIRVDPLAAPGSC